MEKQARASPIKHNSADKVLEDPALLCQNLINLTTSTAQPLRQQRQGAKIDR